MSNFLDLAKFMKDPRKYGYAGNPNLVELGYVPDSQKVSLGPDYTGFEEVQEFETELNHHWFVVCDEGELYGLAGETTEAYITLFGRIGQTKGRRCIEKVNSLYTSELLGTKAAELTKSMFRFLLDDVRELCDGYLISAECSSFIGSRTSAIEQGLYCATKKDLLRDPLYFTSVPIQECTVIRQLRPIFRIPQEAKIALGEVEKGMLELGVYV